MEEYKRSGEEGKTVLVGVDLHRFRWHVTVKREDQELFIETVPGEWETLRRLLDRYPGYSIQMVYGAGYFGFLVHDRVVVYGVVHGGRLYCHPTESFASGVW